MSLITLSYGQTQPQKPFPFEIMTEFFYPYNYEEEGVNKGIAVDALEHIIKGAGYIVDKSDFKLMPWERALLIAKHTPNTLVFSMAKTPDREPHFHWVGPIDKIENGLIALKKSNIKINSVDDIKRYRIGVAKTMPRAVFDNTGVDFDSAEKVDTHEQNIKKLVNGRIDLMGHDMSISDTNMRLLGLNPDDVEVLLPLNAVSIYFAFNKDSDQKVIAELKNQFKLISKKDSRKGKSLLETLREKYFHLENK